MDKILNYEKKFMIYFRLVLVTMIIPFFVFTIEEGVNQLFLIDVVFLAVITIVSQILYYLRYFNKPKLFVFFKYLILFACGFMFFNDNVLIFSTAILIYVFVCIQLMFVLHHKDDRRRIYLTVLNFIPMVVCIVLVQTEVNYIFEIFFMVQFFIVLLGISHIIEINGDGLRAKIEQHRALWQLSQESNEAIQASQNQVKAAYDKISEQKLEMEVKNEQMNRLTSEMYIQNELLSYISTTLELDQLMDLVTDAMVGAIGVDSCSLVIEQLDDEEAIIKTKSNYDANVIIHQFKIALEEGSLDYYFERKTPLIDSNVTEGKYSFLEGRPVGSLILIPLIRSGNVYGLLVCEQAALEFFSDYNIQFYKSIATQITIAVNNARLYAKMEEMATKDGLTNLYNRRHFQIRLNQLFNQLKEKQENLVIVMFDIDRFKNVNDTYGHLFGDEAIKMVSRISEHYAKENGGFAGRYGGEEFVVAIPYLSMEEAYKIIKQMHEDIKTEPLYHNREEIVYINVSIGITVYPDFGTNTEQLLNRSDNAMYYSKRHGRGRITVDSKGLELTME